MLRNVTAQISNMITLTRVMLSCILSLYIVNHFGSTSVPVVISLIVFATDFIDGKIAKYYKSTSLFGAYFDIVADMDIDHNFIITKTRCKELDGLSINKPGRELGEKLRPWLSDGEPDELISEAQRKRLFALAKGHNELLKDVISKYGYESTKDIRKADYEKICDEIEKAS